MVSTCNVTHFYTILPIAAFKGIRFHLKHNPLLLRIRFFFSGSEPYVYFVSVKVKEQRQSELKRREKYKNYMKLKKYSQPDRVSWIL